MPTFNGVDIFGAGCSMATGDLGRDEQENSYCGLNGIESLDHGDRGLVTECSGVLYGATSGDLDSFEITFRSYRDGNAYTLVDSYGDAWQNVKMASFRPSGRIRQDPGGYYYRQYSATFRHMTAR